MAKAKEPVAEEWYPMKLGSTCFDDATTRFYSLRYEFKPASIDSSRPGSLHNNTENKTMVEFFNNQAGKPKVGFQGNSEDCKELDAVLFFDGKQFRLERMHRAVKSLRHIRLPGESSAAAQGMNLKDDELDIGANGNVERISTSQVAEKSLNKPPPAASIQRERIESEEIVPGPSKPDPPAGKKAANKRVAAEPKAKSKKAAPVALPASTSVSKKRQRGALHNNEAEPESPSKEAAVEEEQIEIEELVEEELVEELSEYEEVDISEDEGVDQTAASLRAQVATTEADEAKPSSSSSGSGSSGSGSSSSDSGSDEDSASSADDADM